MRKLWTILLTAVLSSGNIITAEAKETKMNIWIQRADSSTVDVKATNAEEAIQAFNNFDWKKEQEREKQLGPYESVPAGLGFDVWGDERFMHVIPKAENNVQVLYVKTKTVPKKILGFIPSKSQVNEEFLGENLTHENIEEIIRAYFEKDEQTIMKYCNK